ncbi:MAG: hypothetical protein O7G85_08510 [Planctomycetota bacterium]|nr:hypothetical protein [Planctomycetota bacterium]
MFDRRAKTAFAVASVILVGSNLGISSVERWMGMFLHKDPVPLPLEFSRIAKQTDHWNSTIPDELLDEAILDRLGTRKYLNRLYAPNEGDAPRIHLHVAYYTGLIDPVPHVPDRCFVAGGLDKVAPARNLKLPMAKTDWVEHADRINQATKLPYHTAEVRHPFTNERIEVTMPIGEFLWRTTQFSDQRQPGLKIFSGYMFVANGRLTPSPDGVRVMAFDLFERSAYYCKIQLTIRTKAEFTEQDFVDLSADFLDEILPEVMRCLPDWWAHESAIAASASTD